MSKGFLGIIGAGVLGLHIAHYAKLSGQFSGILFFDDTLIPGDKNEFGEIAGGVETIEEHIEKGKIAHLLIGIGYNHMGVRKGLFERFSKLIDFPNIIHPSVYLDPSVKMGQGNIILPGCVFDKGSDLGNNLFFNPSCVVSHDNKIEDHTFFAPAVKTSGFVNIGSCCFIGTNSTLVNNISIGDNIKIGAASLVTKDLKEPGIYLGSPARRIGEWGVQ
jgi:sugar O-acyltransferase (sialic acid O-acetyltransferase NeuD family)